MNKNELKKMLKPLIKECIKEVMFEDGTLSSIIAEVMRGTAAVQPQPIVENRQPQPIKQQPRLETDEEAKARLNTKRKKLMSSMAKGAYNGVNLFEGTTAAPSDGGAQGQGALSGVASNDPGIDITALMNKTTAIWSKMNEKK
tara:strand:- start:3974 stop:4402 length:429 start_codon:yes stop_codon:yes gene_type:complete